MVTVVGYFGIKIREILILQKIDKKWSVPVEIPEKKKLMWDHFFPHFWQKST